MNAAGDSRTFRVCCQTCGREMLTVRGCTLTELEFSDGETLASIPYEESPWPPGEPAMGRCHDCGCLVGEHHQPGCDMEECPRCHGQLIVCDCRLTGQIKGQKAAA